MKMSAVIPSYGGQRLLNRTLSTLLNQTQPLHEIIVVDDGSVRPISVPDGVRLLRLERRPGYRGSSAAKNAGAKAATGDWLIFSDNDILHMPDAVESVANKATMLKRNDVLVSVFSIGLRANQLRDAAWNGDTESMERLYTMALNNGSCIAFVKVGNNKASSEQHCGLINRDFFFAVGGYDEATFQSWGYNNQDLCIRVAMNGGALTSAIPRATNANKNLLCFHQWPLNLKQQRARYDVGKRNAEFRGKYGRDFDIGILETMLRTA